MVEVDENQVIIDDPLNADIAPDSKIDPPHMLASLVPRHRHSSFAEYSVYAYVGEDSDQLTIMFNAEGCDLAISIDARNARKLLTELQREVPELEEILNDGKAFELQETKETK